MKRFVIATASALFLLAGTAAASVPASRSAHDNSPFSTSAVGGPGVTSAAPVGLAPLAPGVDPAVLADIGASAGLDHTRIVAMLASDEGQAEVRSELQRAVNLRVSGVPTVLVDGVPLFSGAIRADLMEAELRKAAGHVRN